MTDVPLILADEEIRRLKARVAELEAALRSTAEDAAVTDLDAIRERHYRTKWGTHYACRLDLQPWPCDTTRLIARVAELEAALLDIGDPHP